MARFDFSGLLTFAALAPAVVGLSIVVAIAIGSPAAHAAPAADMETIRIPVHIRNHDTSPAAAAAIRHRIETAALEACGASAFSLAEIKRSTRESPCWSNAVKTALAQLRTPVLATQPR
ncbi:hypothetical protein Y88_2207 [Novosphingobium nitrogenifigens DSM 19370]|uniref:UrcA family protein n=1 Tax=Novosphingobium nitrogenifigens DSM 19370 TaxID=983920 RepID=F1Z5F5_9SPHN|nr:hypothetical protein Y88_2207 [Novosphingobium nitrogenifigens DSM 19370]